MGGGRSFVSEKMKLLVALLVLQLCFAGFHIVSRVALNIGISKVVYPVYRNIIALLMLGPFSYFFEKKERPPLTFSLLVQFFLVALVGCEQVNIMRKDGLAKILGTIASVGGATIIILYKGPLILHQASQLVGIEALQPLNPFQGIISSGIVIALQTWCIQKGGPVFVASFQPVQTVLVAGMAFVILGDQLYSGGRWKLESNLKGVYSRITNVEQNALQLQIELVHFPEDVLHNFLHVGLLGQCCELYQIFQILRSSKPSIKPYSN
ncbi:unnamed protein product [Fraxinus pennsylvanica]|uniref:WAT1-related protein n=1 Tax=Fraxinus pennsylvanica TaxID=56036 RepID=A0AAD2AEI9_9LAMI|nr:unnamed protein product [Fraxinus pennsylvanica]